mmetsp:Transcript_20670/g.33330  ORF Transcript_20670/g.33330 Transcript_20670/m.33330 type:complete len:120 (+) Transcript_20670:501-860(+)
MTRSRAHYTAYLQKRIQNDNDDDDDDVRKGVAQGLFTAASAPHWLWGGEEGGLEFHISSVEGWRPNVMAASIYQRKTTNVEGEKGKSPHASLKNLEYLDFFFSALMLSLSSVKHRRYGV